MKAQATVKSLLSVNIYKTDQTSTLEADQTLMNGNTYWDVNEIRKTILQRSDRRKKSESTGPR